MSIELSNKGTLLSFSLGENAIISPYSEVSPYRGGAFWCLPNFDEGITPFTVRHGEYRKTEEIKKDEAHTSSLYQFYLNFILIPLYYPEHKSFGLAYYSTLGSSIFQHI